MKVGDKIQVYLDEKIKNAKGVVPGVLKLWQAINGKTGIITEIDGDMIWAKGDRTKRERAFSADTLKVIG